MPPVAEAVMPTEFEWRENDEPHRVRHKAILSKHPEIQQLMVKEWRTFPIVVMIFLAQLSVAYWAQTGLLLPLRWYNALRAHLEWAPASMPAAPPAWGWVLLAAYAFGGTLNHTLQLAVHELSHNLCFENLIANKLLAIFANFVTGVPSAVMFQKYHMEHHQFQGVDGVDTDVPTVAEVRFFTNTMKKVLWLLLQPAFYGLRPLLVKPKTPTIWEAINLGSVFLFDYLVANYIGGRAITYLITGTLLGLGIHPCAGHFIAEHYVFSSGQETYSYYGPCNWVNFNVGYHNEHHDFPKIPWSNLPKVRDIAPEFYNIPHYTSYCAVLWRYITDPRIGPASRIKRKAPARFYKGEDKSE
jgi:sphingolipid delta-4 desaturase